MTLTRETVGNLVKRLQNPPFGTETSERNLMNQAAAALLAAWDERDVLLNRAFDEGQILAALRDCEAERDAMRAALGADDKMISEITEDVVRWKRRAEAAEGELVVTDKLLLAEAQQSLDRLARAEAAEAEIAELKLDAAARDVRVFELREELDNAEAKLAERDAENARLRESLGHAQYGLSWSLARDRDANPPYNNDPCPPITRAMDLIRAALNKEPKT